jgi:protein O-GlcNAc transferase
LSKRSSAVSEALEAASALYRAGRLNDAALACARIVDAHPGSVDALHLFGAVLHKLGDFSTAAIMLERAAKGRPSDSGLRNDLGNAFQDAGRLVEAEKSYREALKRRPNYPDACSNLGGLLHRLGRLEEAEQALRRALVLEPKHILARQNLAIVQLALGKHEETEASYRELVRLQPGSATPHMRLASILREHGKPDEAERAYREVLRLDPDLAAAHNDLGVLLLEWGRLEEARQCFEEALTRDPQYAAAHSNLGSVLTPLGRAEDAERCIREALRIDPQLAGARSNLAMTLNYIEERTQAEVFEAHRAVETSLPSQVEPQSHANVVDPDRRLRIGYVSSDFRFHPVSAFMEPVLANHRPSDFEITCYYSYPRRDATTQRLMGYAQRWRDVYRASDHSLAELIREDAIDILIDLGGHTSHNRLAVFGLKPAPVQATWLGYPNTSGLNAIDYRITDGVADPEGWSEAFHTEILLRLPGPFVCYGGGAEAPAVAPLPFQASGRVTFGCFNNLAKMTSATVAMWVRLLQALPQARLVLKPVSAFSSARTQSEVLQRLAVQGLDITRVEALPPEPAFGQHLARYGDIDIALDVFPYNGTTTTCEALWMGVPVVTLAGKTHASRVGASILQAVGLQEFVAATPAQYVEIALNLASDPERLVQLRAGLRERILASPLMDAERFTRGLESAYRAMWKNWCAGRSL